MRIPVRTQKTSSGFTIVELMLATGLVSIFFLLGSSVITQLFAFQKDVSKRLMDDFSVVNFHRHLTQDLEGSYWSRYGIFSCPSSKSILETDSTGTATISSGGMFELVSSDFSSTIGLVPGTTRVSVATMRNLQAGDLVLLSLGSDFARSAMFKIDHVDRALSQIELSSSTLAVAGTSCSAATTSKPLSDFFGPGANSSVFLTRVKVIQYGITSAGEMTRAVLPGEPEGIVQGMSQVIFKSKWTTSTDEPDSKKKIGQMNFTVQLNYAQETLMGSQSKNLQEQKITAQYTLDSFSYANKYVQTGVPDATQKFPTCAIGYSFQPGVFNISPSDGSFQNMVPIRLTGFVSEKIDGASLDVSFAPLGGGRIYCYLHNPNSGSYPTSGTLDYKKGKTMGVSLNKDGEGYDTYTCAVMGSIAVTASMSYYDAKVSQTKTINCSTDQIVAPTKYKLNGPKPTCDRTWASWDMKSEIVSMDGDPNMPISLGMLSVEMDSSCLWGNDDTTDSDSSGMAGSCYPWDPDNLGKDLRRVYLRPYKQQVSNAAGNANAFPDAGNYIDCN